MLNFGVPDPRAARPKLDLDLAQRLLVGASERERVVLIPSVSYGPRGRRTESEAPSDAEHRTRWHMRGTKARDIGKVIGSTRTKWTASRA
jgi:hypothetical protein